MFVDNGRGDRSLEAGAARLRDEAGVRGERVHWIRHGVMDYLTALPDQRPLPAELEGAEGPVILFFGLLRRSRNRHPVEAFQRLDGAELWVVGCRGCRWSRSSGWRERAQQGSFPAAVRRRRGIPAIFRRADIVACRPRHRALGVLT